MKSVCQFAMAAGTLFSLILVDGTGVHAQDNSGPAYLVVEVDVKDQEGFNEYAEKATQTIAQYGGTFIVMDENPQTIEGAEPDGNVVIIKFDSISDAKKWLNSPEYSVVKGIRHKAADTRQYLVEGLPVD